ncbi:MAG: cell envelope protein SmpA [Rhodobacterales bacterium 32-66-7]|nr:MAG: cell envelope protein SmpA [Rhodobacterales bacterium 12-65-15]OYX24645.1 MAG: cell envelope protein SmpA [Rhodobacterales bacterium 32-66-7]
MTVSRLAQRLRAAGRFLRGRGMVLVLGLTVAACSTLYRNHGYVPAPDELALVEVGVDTWDTVGQKIGRPSTSGLLNDEGWYYVQSRYELRGGREPKEIERTVLAVTFNSAGVVENIASFGLEDGQVVEISRRVTETNIKGFSVIRQLLTNFGNFNPGAFLE